MSLLKSIIFGFVHVFRAEQQFFDNPVTMNHKLHLQRPENFVSVLNDLSKVYMYITIRRILNNNISILSDFFNLQLLELISSIIDIDHCHVTMQVLSTKCQSSERWILCQIRVKTPDLKLYEDKV